MNAYYVPIHYFERDKDDDDVVMIVTQQDYKPCELDDLIKTETRRHKESAYDCKEDMTDAIFNALAKKIGGVWKYLELQNTLTIGGFDEPEDESVVEDLEGRPLSCQ
jgi:hypothetical protein